MLETRREQCFLREREILVWTISDEYLVMNFEFSLYSSKLVCIETGEGLCPLLNVEQYFELLR